jgi:hypothetical protein
MKVQSTEAYKELQSALSEHIQHLGKAWETHSTLLDNRERAQERLALQVHTQSQELANVQMKAKEDGDQMSGLYGKSRQEAKRIPEEAQTKAESAEQERKAAERSMKKDFERKFKEFTSALQTKISDERIQKSVRSIAWSALTPKEGDTKPVEQGFCL